MLCIKFSLFAAVALLAQILHARNVRQRQVVKENPRTVSGEYGCYTDFGREEREDVKTFSRLYSYTFPVTAYAKTTPSTTTVTQTSTSTLQGTATATATITSTKRTSSYTVSTVSAPSGFTPIAFATGAAAITAALVLASDSTGELKNVQNVKISLGIDPHGNCRARPRLYPQQVVCEQVVRVYTTTTSFYTYTGTVTTTVNVPGPTAYATVTTTTTSTTTITDVVPNPTETMYAACQSNNWALGRGEQPPSFFVEAVHSWRVGFEERRTETPEACCIACQRTEECSGSLWHATTSTCYIFKTDLCRSPGELRSSTTVDFRNAFYASNGQCGSWRISDARPGSPADV
ncbi:hypothetical protein CCHL11_07679 [Colletotrichum chlorophyti]|uniref:Apple domain-containing protein n=1 Tax=Colletotrichum chlorophyti TaxID=708187 RepID=A0A1Q8RCG5_9PEZI|nr:hypothetical protein CCHL11_07679 [Colletotrichum chlorophyti]